MMLPEEDFGRQLARLHDEQFVQEGKVRHVFTCQRKIVGPFRIQKYCSSCVWRPGAKDHVKNTSRIV